MHFTEFKL